MNFITEENRIYLAGEDGSTLAEVCFEKDEDGAFNISRTFVDPSLAGKGIAGQLVSSAYDYITSQGYKVKATCSYAARWLEKNNK